MNVFIYTHYSTSIQLYWLHPSCWSFHIAGLGLTRWYGQMQVESPAKRCFNLNERSLNIYESGMGVRLVISRCISVTWMFLSSLILLHTFSIVLAAPPRSSQYLTVFQAEGMEKAQFPRQNDHGKTALTRVRFDLSIPRRVRSISPPSHEIPGISQKYAGHWY